MDENKEVKRGAFTPKTAPQKKKRALVSYLVIMFLVALLLIALSYFSQQRAQAHLNAAPVSIEEAFLQRA